jgi:oligopeptide transport system permease protein
MARPGERARDDLSPTKLAFLRLGRNRLAMLGLALVLLIALAGFSAPLLAQLVSGFSYEEQHTEFRLKPPGTRDVSYDYPTYDGDDRHFSYLDRDGDGMIGGEREMAALYWIDRFLLFAFNDYDLVRRGEHPTAELRSHKPAGVHPDDLISREEYPASFDELDRTFKQEFLDHVRAHFERMHGGRAPSAAEERGVARQLFATFGLDRETAFLQLDHDRDGYLSLNEVNDFRRRFRPFANPDRALAQFDLNHDGHISRDEYPGAPRLNTFWLGTDRLGRDVLTRVLFGARVSIAIALLSALVSFLIGTSWGTIAGYLGGRTDSVMMRIVDVLYGLPFMFVVILLIVVFGRNTVNLFIALGAVQWLTMSRVVRGQVLSLKNREFIEAAEALGLPKRRIIVRHLIANTVGPVIVYSTLMVPATILEEAFLSFLGLGVQPPYPSWGNMITEGSRVMDISPWLIIYPGLALGLTLFGMNFLGDGLRDALDPQSSKR